MLEITFSNYNMYMPYFTSHNHSTFTNVLSLFYYSLHHKDLDQYTFRENYSKNSAVKDDARGKYCKSRLFCNMRLIFPFYIPKYMIGYLIKLLILLQAVFMYAYDLNIASIFCPKGHS